MTFVGIAITIGILAFALVGLVALAWWIGWREEIKERGGDYHDLN